MPSIAWLRFSAGSVARGEEISAREIAQALNAQAESFARELLPGGRRNGKFWEAGSVNGEKGQSLKLNLTGPRQGCWTDFSAAPGAPDHSGDVLTLVAVTLFGGNHREALAGAIAWAKSRLGFDDMDPSRLATVRREYAARAVEQDAEAAREAERMRKRAAALWHGAEPIKGTPAEAYLRGRGIDFRALGKAPGSLRYHGAVWCPVRRAKHPAMVACIMALSGELLGVHRTFLDVPQWWTRDPEQAVGVVKLPPDAKGRRKSHKLSMGDYAGGCIPLWKGASANPLRALPAGMAVHVSEGIEDGLSVAMAAADRRIVAAVSLSNIGGLQLPVQAGDLVLIAQNDAPGSRAVDAFERAIGRQQEAARVAGAERAVRLMWPEAKFKDFNDQLLGRVMG